MARSADGAYDGRSLCNILTPEQPAERLEVDGCAAPSVRGEGSIPSDGIHVQEGTLDPGDVESGHLSPALATSRTPSTNISQPHQQAPLPSLDKRMFRSDEDPGGSVDDGSLDQTTSHLPLIFTISSISSSTYPTHDQGNPPDPSPEALGVDERQQIAEWSYDVHHATRSAEEEEGVETHSTSSREETL